MCNDDHYETLKLRVTFQKNKGVYTHCVIAKLSANSTQIKEGLVGQRWEVLTIGDLVPVSPVNDRHDEREFPKKAYFN